MVNEGKYEHYWLTGNSFLSQDDKIGVVFTSHSAMLLPANSNHAVSGCTEGLISKH